MGQGLWEGKSLRERASPDNRLASFAYPRQIRGVSARDLNFGWIPRWSRAARHDRSGFSERPVGESCPSGRIANALSHYFCVARHPSRINAKRGNRFIQADFTSVRRRFVVIAQADQVAHAPRRIAHQTADRNSSPIRRSPYLLPELQGRCLGACHAL